MFKELVAKYATYGTASLKAILSDASKAVSAADRAGDHKAYCFAMDRYSAARCVLYSRGEY